MDPLQKTEHDEFDRRYGVWLQDERERGPNAGEMMHAEYVLRSLGYSKEAAHLGAYDMACHLTFFLYTHQRAALGSYAEEIEAGDGRQYGTRIADLERECKSLRAGLDQAAGLAKGNFERLRGFASRSGGTI